MRTASSHHRALCKHTAKHATALQLCLEFMASHHNMKYIPQKKLLMLSCHSSHIHYSYIQFPKVRVCQTFLYFSVLLSRRCPLRLEVYKRGDETVVSGGEKESDHSWHRLGRSEHHQPPGAGTVRRHGRVSEKLLPVYAAAAERYRGNGGESQHCGAGAQAHAQAPQEGELSW